MLASSIAFFFYQILGRKRSHTPLRHSLMQWRQELVASKHCNCTFLVCTCTSGDLGRQTVTDPLPIQKSTATDLPRFVQLLVMSKLSPLVSWLGLQMFAISHMVFSKLLIPIRPELLWGFLGLDSHCQGDSHVVSLAVSLSRTEHFGLLCISHYQPARLHVINLY